jgi:hypothetical protein
MAEVISLLTEDKDDALDLEETVAHPKRLNGD